MRGATSRLIGKRNRSGKGSGYFSWASGWQRHVDPATGWAYYYNPLTEESEWENAGIRGGEDSRPLLVAPPSLDEENGGLLMETPEFDLSFRDETFGDRLWSLGVVLPLFVKCWSNFRN